MAWRFQEAISGRVSLVRASRKNEKYLINLFRVTLFSFKPWQATSKRHVVAGTRNMFLSRCVRLFIFNPFYCRHLTSFSPVLTSLAETFSFYTFLFPRHFEGNHFMSSRMSTGVNGVSIIVYHWIFSRRNRKSRFSLSFSVLPFAPLGAGNWTANMTSSCRSQNIFILFKNRYIIYK